MKLKKIYEGLNVYKAPQNVSDNENDITIFLAGSIEMGKAEDWQTRVTDALSNYNVTIFNPRRDDWDSSWEQSINDPKFSEQVNWEMDRLEECKIIFLYLSPSTKSPISLLELGIHSKSNKVICCCPDGFWRKGNVEIVCQRNDIPMFNTLDASIQFLTDVIEKWPTYNGSGNV